MKDDIHNGPVRWAYLVPIAAILVSFFGLAWVHTQCMELKISIHQIRSGNKDLAAANRKLEIERTRLKSPARLRRLGEMELGLQRVSAEKTPIFDLREFVVKGGNHEKTP